MVQRGEVREVVRADQPAGCGRRTVATPGFVDCHLHSSFQLSRGLADEANAQSFLFDRMYPYEAALDEKALRASARLGIAELLRNGTTTLLDMGTVRHYDAVFAAAKEAGLDMARIDKDMASPEVKATLEENFRMAEDMALNGTPSYVIGKQIVIGAVGLDELKQKIDVARCGKASC